MAWNKDIPMGSDPVNQSQMAIQGNFQALDPIFNGINNFLELPIQGSAPATSATRVALYSKTGITTNQELFFRRISNGVEIDFTGSGQSANGWSRLPSGLIIKWGSATVNRNALTTVTFPTGGTIPVFSAVYIVSATQSFSAGPTASNLNCFVSAGNFTPTAFQTYANAAVAPLASTITITYYAIGI